MNTNNYLFCNKCKQFLPLELFDKSTTIQRGYQWHCKPCKQKYRIENREKICKQKREYIARPEVKARRTKYSETFNKTEWYKNYQREYMKKKRKTDAEFNLSHRMRSGIGNRLKRLIKTGKSHSTVEYLGCSIYELKIYLESLFTEGMTWEKYLNREIHIDHIRPCVSFDLTDIEQQKICFHYTNLQPLWAKDNLLKGSKF